MKLFSVHNPVGINPAQLIPIFTDDPKSKTPNLFYQKIDQEYRVTEFAHLRSRADLFDRRVFGCTKEVMVGDYAVYAFLSPNGRQMIFDCFPEYHRYLFDNIENEEFTNAPFLQLSVATQLGLDDLEKLSAKRCVTWIARTSREFARNWVEHGIMSQEARDVAKRELRHIAKQNVHSDEILSDIWEKLLLNKTYATPSAERAFDEGFLRKLGVSIIEYDLLAELLNDTKLLMLSPHDRRDLATDQKLQLILESMRKNGALIVQVNSWGQGSMVGDLSYCIDIVFHIPVPSAFPSALKEAIRNGMPS